MSLLQRTQTKLEEVRDFHMEKAINSSTPMGPSQEGREGERMAADISSSRRCDGGQEQKLHNITLTDSELQIRAGMCARLLLMYRIKKIPGSPKIH